jgi:hypothetical protein
LYITYTATIDVIYALIHNKAYRRFVSNKISSLLDKQDIRTIHIHVKKNTHTLRNVKEKFGLKMQQRHGMCWTEGQNHQGEPEKSAMAQHGFETGHIIDFSSAFVLNRSTGCIDRLRKDSTEIRIHSVDIDIR